MADTDVLRTKEAAAYLRISNHTLHKLVRDGIIPAARIGTNWRFNRADLENHVRATASQPFDTHKG